MVGTSKALPTPVTRPPNNGWTLGAHSRDRALWTQLRDRVQRDVAHPELTSVDLEEILQELNRLSLPNPRIRAEELAAMMTLLIQVLPVHSDLLGSELARFVQTCCLKDKVKFSPEELHRVVHFLLAFLDKCSAWYVANTLRALGVVLYGHAEYVSSTDLQNVITIVLQSLDPAGVDIDARYAATTCLSNLCPHYTRVPEARRIFSSLLRLVSENFRQQALTLSTEREYTDRVLVKACLGSLNCLHAIVGSQHADLQDRIRSSLPGLLDSMRQVLGFGVDLRSDNNSEGMQLVPKEKLPGYDSDSSSGTSRDGEGACSPGALAPRLRSIVLQTLETMSKFFPDQVTLSMGRYLPEQSTPCMTLFQGAPSVLTLLVADPADKVRASAAKFLEAFWSKVPMKQYFRHASSLVAPSTSFASMPKRMSLVLYQVHAALVYSVQHERSDDTLTHIVKAVTAVIQHCPYASVAVVLDGSDFEPSLGDLLQRLASCLYFITMSPVHEVRSLALAALSALLNIQSQLPPLLQWMTTPMDGRTAMDVTHCRVHCGHVPPVRKCFVEELLRQASQSRESHRALLRLEAISLLGKVAKNYASAVSVLWSQVASFLLAAFQDSDPNVRLQAVKVLENYLRADCHGDESSDGRDVVTSTKREADSFASAVAGKVQRLSVTPRKAARSDCLTFMAAHLIRAFHDSSHHVRASVCSCFTLLTAHDWQQLSRQQSRLATAQTKAPSRSIESYKRLFLETPNDSSPVVRAAGCRLLGSLYLMPPFKTSAFAEDVVNLMLDAFGDSTLNVRVRAAWSLGNVCTTIGPEALQSVEPEMLEEQSSAALYDLLTPAIMLRVTETMLQYINDNDKVASSVARTLGLVNRWVYYPAFRATIASKRLRDFDDLLAKSMRVLAKKVALGSPKVRWNACYAIAKVLLCPELPIASSSWAPSVFRALLDAIEQQENFKVRISAASALRVPPTRDAYGSIFPTALRCVLDAVESASSLKDVTEFKYKEQLETQLSFSIIHLIYLATREDDLVVWQAVQDKSADFFYDWVYHNLHRVCKSAEEASYAHPQANRQVVSDEDGVYCSNGGGDAHDASPVTTTEVLCAVRTLLRIFQQQDTHRQFRTSRTLLYDAKLRLERNVLDTNMDVAFEL